jgi:hypothetical protein
VLLYSVVGFALTTGPAYAACTDEETLFVRALVSPTSGNALDVKGTSTVNLVKDRDLGCANYDLSSPEAHSTAHVTNATQTKYVEVGWVEHQDSSYSYGHRFQYFYEGNDGTRPLDQSTFGGLASGADLPLPPQNGNYAARFWENNVSGGSRWNMWIDFENDGVTDASRESPSMTFSHGHAFGETGRRGGSGTGASDQHSGLKYFKPDRSGWAYWPNNSPDFTYGTGGISGWKWCLVTASKYTVIKTSNTC